MTGKGCPIEVWHANVVAVSIGLLDQYWNYQQCKLDGCHSYASSSSLELSSSPPSSFHTKHVRSLVYHHGEHAERERGARASVTSLRNDVVAGDVQCHL